MRSGKGFSSSKLIVVSWDVASFAWYRPWVACAVFTLQLFEDRYASVQYSNRLRIIPQEHPMMICEPSFNPVHMREKLVEMAFEKYMCPAVFLGRNAVLSSFATGRQTSMMIDSGHKGTTGLFFLLV